MPVEIGKLPLVLCGPILRRVEPRVVSVFVALKHARKVTLTVYPGVVSASARPAPLAGGTATRETVAVGKYLHVAVVTTRPSADLEAGKNYSYDIRFEAGATTDTLDAGPQQSDLDSLKLLEGPGALGYAAGKLPTFAGPPARLDDLRIVHASCRKPHGEGKDMLPTLDTIIGLTRSDPLKRPHQLFLTGDQIYADDVSGPLLFMLNETGEALLGWQTSESLPVVNAKPGSLRLDARAETAKAGKISSQECANHLLGLGEFLSMYLFTWSDAVWPAALPTYAERFPADYQWLEERGRVGLLVLNPASAENLKRLTLAHEERSYNKALPVIDEFRRGVANVRRALANVPTFMIFDDHEISDDWYLDLAWIDDVHANPLGRRVVINGLLAYGIFQGWGNDPLGEFGPGKNGEKLLTLLESLSKGLVASGGNAYDENNADYVAIRTLLRVVTPVPLAGGISWHYVVKWPTHHTVVLDTRTRRAFSGTDRLAQPDLIGSYELARVLGPDQNGGALGPVDPNGPLTVVVSPAPVIGHLTHEWVAKELGQLGASRFGDREMWLVENRRGAFEDLLRRLSARRRVLILSGDVHYGHTATVQYWNNRAGEVGEAAIVQLVSSGCKNQDTKTKAIGALPPGTAGALSEIPDLEDLRDPEVIARVRRLMGGDARSYLGWSKPGEHLSGSGKAIPVKGTPAVKELPSGDMEVTPADWRYRVLYSADMSTAEERTVGVSGPTRVGAMQQKIRDAARLHRDTAIWDQMRSAVGYNNIAEVFFESTRTGVLVHHQLWFQLKGLNTPLPYTVHSASLAIPDATVPRPAPNLKIEAPPPVAAWTDLISFRPPADVQQLVRARGSASWYFHRIEDAYLGGPVNLDYYPIHVKQLPRASLNSRVTAEEMLATLRRLLVSDEQGKVIDTDVSEFRPYYPGTTEAGDNALKWGMAPVGAVIHIKMKTPGGVTIDTGSVMCTRNTPQHWIFSTIHTPRDGDHPVSGNRMFGFTANADGTYTFFTRGADRLTGELQGGANIAGDALNLVFARADALWKSLQERVAKYINDNGGAATVPVEKTVSVRVPWYIANSTRFYSPRGLWTDRVTP